ncbi:hypothetical protein NXW10_13165 [Bacteroides fragilis]|jgi:hypothetical protein|nr:hypothetical protein NXW10_13165 [Bacteroides fragilis]
MKQTLEEAAYDYATNKTKFRKEVLKEVDPDNYVSRKSDCMEDFQCGAEWQAEQSPWISIDEQYPEDKQPVLCSSPIYGKVVLCWDELSQSWSYPESGEFYCDWDKVVCWMSIPEL